jgi:hypothetical protein
MPTDGHYDLSMTWMTNIDNDVEEVVGRATWAGSRDSF